MQLPGGITARSADVIRFDGTTYTVAFPTRPSDTLPAGVQIDAISMINGDLLVSFDITVRVGEVTVDDEDLVRITTNANSTTFYRFFDGSEHGVAPGLDLDAVHYIPGSGAGEAYLLMSFDGSGSIAGTYFDDEDVVQYALHTGVWTRVYDMSSMDTTGWRAVDLDAFYAFWADVE